MGKLPHKTVPVFNVEELKSSIVQFGCGLIPAAKKVTQAASEFHHVSYNLIQTLYIQENGQLPSGTKEEQKKAVLNWYFKGNKLEFNRSPKAVK